MGDTELLALARKGLEEAARQLLAEGPPFEPYLLDESLYGCALYDKKGGTDPLLLAKAAIPFSLPAVQRCVLLFEDRVEFGDGKLAHALVAMACDRDAGEGVALAQRYAPKRWFRSLRIVGEPEALPACANFIRAAFANEPVQDEALARLSPDDEADLDRRANAILDYFSAQFPPSYRRRVVDPAEFPHLDLDWYDSVRASLGKNGFRHLADVEIENLTENNRSYWLPSMVRQLLAADGSVLASAWQLKTTPMGHVYRSNPVPTLSLETEFEDGRFLRTCNGTGADYPQPDWLIDEWQPADSTPSDMVAAHRRRVEAYAKTAGARPRLARDHGEFVAALDRQHARISEFRSGVDGLGASLISQAARGDARLVARIHEKLAQRQALRG
jgi:hypothetical protein